MTGNNVPGKGLPLRGHHDANGDGSPLSNERVDSQADAQVGSGSTKEWSSRS
jgi:hypothetical protein